MNIIGNPRRDEEGKDHFELKRVVSFDDLVSQKVTVIEESDLLLQNDSHIIQFKYIEKEEKKKIIEPGFFTLADTPHGIKTLKIEFRERNLLEDITSTSAIVGEAKKFFSKLHIYDQLERPKKRGVLLHSVPGCGKSASIEKFCQDLAKEDPGTVVFVWPTSKVDAHSIIYFLSNQSEYAPECTRLVLVMEDIGGCEPGEHRGHADVDASLLNLLDGVGVTFKLPTFIIATTNHPESLLGSIADRPGRFDLVIPLQPPSADERVRLLSFIAKRDLTDEEEKYIRIKEADGFSVAHLEEIVVRSLLHDKTFMQVIDELIAHSKLFNRGFEAERGGLGFVR